MTSIITATQRTLQAILPPLRAAWGWITRLGNTLLVLAIRFALLVGLLAGLGDGRIQPESLREQVTALARAHLFDYVDWEIAALWNEARAELLGVGPYLDDAAARAIVRDYLARVSAARDLDAQIERLYADPQVADPAAASADLRAQRDALRAELDADRGLAESVIEAQVAAVLVDQGFGLWGQVLPPVAMHFSELPNVLVVSPRDRIAFAVDITLDPLPVDRRAVLEAHVDQTLDVASLVVPIGGMSLYPSMIVEPGYDDLARQVARAVEVTAHEWAHHYLMFFPLGLEYTARPETRIINETTATFFGQAVAQAVMARYYPDLAPPVYPSFLTTPEPAPEPGVPIPEPAYDPDTPPPFDFAREMHATRVRVDYLLRQGKVAAAELYMRARQRVFARHGYPIRKLNQAYFAFYGGYQGSPGAGGDDPTGPAVETLLRASADLEAFLTTMRGITTRAELLSAAGLG